MEAPYIRSRRSRPQSPPIGRQPADLERVSGAIGARDPGAGALAAGGVRR